MNINYNTHFSFSLLPHESSRIRQGLESLHFQDCGNPYVLYKSQQKKIRSSFYPLLPERIQLALSSFKLTTTYESFFIKGFSPFLHFLPPTPSADNTTNGKDYLSEYTLIGIGSSLGLQPYCNKHEKDGAIIQQLIPLPKKAWEVSGVGHKQPFGLHSENIHEETPPAYLGLFCLRGDPNAKSWILSVDKLLQYLPPWVREGMARADYEHRTGPSFGKYSFLRAPILTRDINGIPYLRHNINNGRVIALSLAAQKVLDYLDVLLRNEILHESIILKPGDCLILNNRRCLHGRSDFVISTPYATRRWLQRIYFCEDHDRSPLYPISN